MPDQPTTPEFKPAYVSFGMLDKSFERMRQEGMPARIDRSYLGTASGSAKAQFLAAAKGLDLLDAELRPTETLRVLVQEPERRPEIIGQLIAARYEPIIALGTNATQQQLEEAFRDHFGLSGSTVRKAIAFYLAAAKFSGIELSPHFSAPRSTASAGTRRRRAAKTPPPEATPPAPRDAFADLRTKYVETLLDKFAAANGEVDAELANRIERLVGFEQPISSSKETPD